MTGFRWLAALTLQALPVLCTSLPPAPSIRFVEVGDDGVIAPEAPAWAEVELSSPAAFRGTLDAVLRMTDDRDAYNAAVARRIAVTRTLRVLEIAAERELLDFPTVIARLRVAGFYMPEDVVDEMLARDATRKAAAQEHLPDTQET